MQLRSLRLPGSNPCAGRMTKQNQKRTQSRGGTTLPWSAREDMSTRFSSNNRLRLPPIRPGMNHLMPRGRQLKARKTALHNLQERHISVPVAAGAADKVIRRLFLFWRAERPQGPTFLPHTPRGESQIPKKDSPNPMQHNWNTLGSQDPQSVAKTQRKRTSRFTHLKRVEARPRQVGEHPISPSNNPQTQIYPIASCDSLFQHKYSTKPTC